MTAPAILQQAGTPGLRLFQIAGDSYEPALRRGGFIMVAPANRFSHDTDYLLDFGDGECPYVVSRASDGFHVQHRNARYMGFTLDAQQLRQAIRAIVVAEIRVRDTGLVYAAISEAGAPFVRTQRPRVAA
jgi:hypothetical protein